MCEQFVRGGSDSAQMNPSAHVPHVVTVLSIFDATPPTSCLVSSSLCNEYSPQKLRLPWPLSATGGKFLSSINVERSGDRTAAAYSQTKKWSCEQITPMSASKAWLRRAPDYSASNFQLVVPRSLFTVSPRWWTPPPPPTPVWPFLLLCDWLEWTEDEAEKVPTKIPAPRSHLLRWSTSHGQSSSKVPILILSQSINRAGGAFPNISGPAQNCLPSQIHHSFQNILENYFLFLEMSLQGYLVVFRRNLFSAVNRTLTTCVCQPADLDLSRLSLMVQGHTKYEMTNTRNWTSLNWSHTLFKTQFVNLGWLIRLMEWMTAMTMQLPLLFSCHYKVSNMATLTINPKW